MALRLLITFLLSLQVTHAGEGFYPALSYEFGGVVAKNNVTNGSTGSTPAFYIGYKVSTYALEFGLLSYDLHHDRGEGDNGAVYSLDIEDTIYRLIFRFSLLPSIDGFAGISMHNITASYTRLDVSQEVSSEIDGTTGGIIFGLDFKREVITNLELYVGAGLDMAREEVNILFFHLGVRYFVF